MTLPFLLSITTSSGQEKPLPYLCVILLLTEVLLSVKLLFVVHSVCGNTIINSYQKDFKHEKPKRFMLHPPPQRTYQI